VIESVESSVRINGRISFWTAAAVISVYLCCICVSILQADIESRVCDIHVLLSRVCQRSVWWSVRNHVHELVAVERGGVDHVTLVWSEL